MIIPANVPSSFVASLGAASLLAGMRVFDTSTGSPVQITGQPGQVNGVYPMSEIFALNTYLAQFTAKPAHTYVFVFNVFTDDTYATVNGSYAEQSSAASAEFLTPVFVQSLKAIIGCENQPLQKPVISSQASDQTVLLSFEDERRNPIDVTTATVIEVNVLEADGVTILSKTLMSGISLVSGKPSQALVQFLAADLALLPTGDVDLKTKISISGQNIALNLYNAMSIEPDAV